MAREEQPDYSLISGDVFDVGRLWSDRCCEEIIMAIHYIKELAAVSGQVVVMRGTPNHDGAGQFNVLSEMFEDCLNVHVIITPLVLTFEDADIAVLPGFDRGVYRAKFPGLSSEDENEAFTQELSHIVTGLRAQCRQGRQGRKSILMAHYTVPGCNTESGQTMMLTQFEPVIPQEALLAAGYDLVALGHIHRPQRILSQDWYYSGAINQINFNDEGQERGFWIHTDMPFGGRGWDSKFYKTPVREHVTFEFTDADITAINLGHIDEVAFNYWRYSGAVKDRIVRIHYSCSAENSKAINKALIEKELLADGAFMVWEILPDKIDEFANRTELVNATDPEVNLIKYLEEKQVPADKIQEMVLKARPIITDAEASMPTAVNTGTFEPIEISVKNYRNYEEETFNFEDITFCTINGQNGAGKSSLFMDAIIDCLYEQPREGVIKDDSGKSPWLRNNESVRSGYIMFTFRIGEKKYRVTRTRTRSGKGTLNIAYFTDGRWEDCSKERYNDTQQEILNIIGMDSFTFKSCALIMQDQYGLFLQAKPEERVEVLGTLLGLGIYQAMEKIASDKAKAFGARTRELKQEVDIRSSAISGFGNPEKELESSTAEMAEQEKRLAAKMEERDKNKLLLTHHQEAAERRTKLLASIKALESKKAAAEQSRASQQAIMDSSSIILGNRPVIEAKAAEHDALVEKERVLSNESALYSSKLAEAAEYRKQEAAEQESIEGMKRDVTRKEAELAALQPTDQDAVIRENAAEYERYGGLLRQAQELQRKYAEAVAEKDRRAYAVDSKRAYINQENRRLGARKADLERRTELLKNSGCLDIERAECRFLSDALDAKKQLPTVEAEISDFVRKEDAALQALVREMEEAVRAVREVGYDEGLLKEYQSKVSELTGAPEALKKLEERDSRIALIKARADNLHSNIREAEIRLATVRLKAVEAEQERDKYADSFAEHAEVQRTILILKPWLEKEKQLPVAEERKNTAAGRLLELAEEISSIETEVSEKRQEADRESLGMEGIESLTAVVAGLNAEVDAINTLVREKQMKIGALQQKAEQISKLKKEIVELQEKQTEYAREAADYDTLKAAFSQSGVPHQIIRSIIPQLTATSNTILGQMTGGKMGVEFRLERLQKNGKEKVSLDIFIEEYGKSTLPYLSKSGGEKVKSSLSVILALAEIKSSSAGIQLGFLQIDEPPFLDSEGTQAYVDALEAIQDRYRNLKIMAITHDQEFKARFPQSITVYKDDNGSHVRWD